MRLGALWFHLLGVVVWIGGLVYQAHVLLPGARRGDVRLFVDAVARGRATAWTAVAVVVLTGFYNVTQLGSLERVLESGRGLLLAGKFLLVIAAVTLAGQRDFGQVPRLRRASDPGETAAALRAITWLDRMILALALAIVWLGLAISRA